MNRVILANGNKLGWTTALTALSFGICVFPLVRMSSVEIEYLTTDDVIRRLLILPLTVSFYVFVVCFALMGFDTAKAQVSDESEPVREGERKALKMAQVLGVVWLNPLHRRDFPTEWRILRTLGLIKPDRACHLSGANALKLNTLQPALTVARQNGESETLRRAHERYIDEMFALLGRGQLEGLGGRAQIDAIRVEYAIPAYRLDPIEVQEDVRRRILGEFASGNAALGERPVDVPSVNVHVTPGGVNAGFTALNAALDYLQENPDKSVWVMNWDAPDCPSKDKQSNENMALLVLAGPGFEAECAPLAWIGKAAAGDIEHYAPRPGAVRGIEAWRGTVAMAAANANSGVEKIDYVIHDAGTGSDVASARFGMLGRSLTEMLAGFDCRKQTFNAAAQLGDMGAGSALTNIAMAIGRAHHMGNTVLVAGTTHSDHPVAVVVVPHEPPDGARFDAVRLRARSDSSGCVPWWGCSVAQASCDTVR